jgi:hypothetical protein
MFWHQVNFCHKGVIIVLFFFRHKSVKIYFFNIFMLWHEVLKVWYERGVNLKNIQNINFSTIHI